LRARDIEQAQVELRARDVEQMKQTHKAFLFRKAILRHNRQDRQDRQDDQEQLVQTREQLVQARESPKKLPT
jgi:hypothetical protein